MMKLWNDLSKDIKSKVQNPKAEERMCYAISVSTLHIHMYINRSRVCQNSALMSAGVVRHSGVVCVDRVTPPLSQRVELLFPIGN